MKFILSILAVLAIVFLIGCSAKDTRDNKLSNSEITKLGKKYGGVYVFNKKFEKEIDDREREKKNYMDNFFKTKKVFKKDDLKVLDNTLPQTLSNGKKYYTSTRTYSEDYNKQAKLPEIYKEKIINFIGQEDYNKFKPSIDIGYFYVDNDEVVPIELSATYSYQGTKFGFFGDEGRGFSLSRDEIYTIKGGNRFYLEDLERK